MEEMVRWIEMDREMDREMETYERHWDGQGL